MSEKAMMAGIVSEDFGPGGRDLMLERLMDEQRCQSVDSLSEWRSYEQVENGTPSTSPPYWDTDDDDDGPKPSELYGKFTWKIENFSTISKRELRSNAFEVGGYKWFILIYPQGCDVCNHLSLFLCVANHEKLLPGWSHFAQFTIAVVNKDPKKSKYSDTLHRFWKKEHDWGWKKFMELSKVLDGFIVADTLVIKAQVQVIREKAHRPFRCLDCQYRRELLRVYLSNVEQICRRFVEERRGKLSKLIEDNVRWSSFRAFWLGMDHNARRHMCRDKTDAILKVVVKHFFIEKEVTSTLVMDSLYSGLKALECQSMNKKSGTKLLEMEKQIAPLVHVEKDMFVLADDVFLLLERAASEPLPHQPLPPKDDKGSQNRTKDGSSGEEFNKDSIERDERRLTELGRRTVEIFILTHIFSRIEVAYQEAVALKRQEELIREEEAAGHAENELKAKRGASEKEKRSKKKQTKKRSSQKGKDRGRNEKSDPVLQDKHQEDGPSNEKSPGDLSFKETQLLEKNDSLEGVSRAFDTRDEVADALQPDLEDRDASTISWGTDASEIHPTIEASGSRIQNGDIERRSPSVMDDSSSACSTESVPSAVMSGPYKGNSLPNNKSQTSPKRGKNQRGKEMREHTGSVHGGSNMLSDTATSADRICDTARANQPETEAVVLSLKDRILRLEQDLVEKEEEVSTLQKKLNVKVQVDVERPSKLASAEPSSSSSSLGKKLLSIEQQPKQTSEKNAATSTNIAEPVSSVQPSSSGPAQTEKSASFTTRLPQISSMSEVQRQTTPAKSTVALQVAAVSRPSSAPLIPGPRPAAPIVSTVHTMPLLSRSVSAAGRLGTDRSPSAQSYIPQSYLNAIVGKTSMGASPAGLSYPSTSSSSQDAACSQSPSVFVPYSSILPPQASVRKDQSPTRPGLTFGSVALGGALHGRKQCRDNFSSPLRNSDNAVRLNCKGELQAKQHSQEAASASSRLCGMMPEEFPHLDIINDLLDEEQSLGRAANGEHQQHYHHHHSLSRQYTFPGSVAISDIGSSSSSSRLDQAKQYYGEGFPRVYGSSSGPLSGARDAHLQQVDLATFGNNQIDGLVQNRWPYSHADLSNPSMLNMGSPDSNGYSYQVADYSSLACGVNGYTMYRPANGL